MPRGALPQRALQARSGDELRRRGVEADDVDHPRVVQVCDRRRVNALLPITGPLRPATTGPLGFEPKLPGLEPGVLPLPYVPSRTPG
jgi:hypothetical protein